uniref:2-oxoglutarate dehydrogenase, mitochondrial n=1 Tax=Ditylenchus dipsaci TaxID=166011 RepID=A0A915EQU5_9BILA
MAGCMTVFDSKIYNYICSLLSGAMNRTSGVLLRKSLVVFGWSKQNRTISLDARRFQAQGPARSTVTAEPFLNGSSGVYIERMYESWLEDPSSVHKSWDVFFSNVEAGAAPGQAFQSPPALSHVTSSALRQPSAHLVPNEDINRAIHDHLKIQLLIRSYQTRGHNIADLDPLGINSADLDDTIPRELELDFYGFSESDLDREFVLPPTTFIGGDRNRLTLREIVDRLKAIYCHHTGVEYMHLTNYDQQEWIRRHFEAPRVTELTPAQKKVLFKRLIRSTKFEDFLAKKWPSEKRFGLEGCEVLIPSIKQVIDRSSALGVDSIVIGMPHRGRLNVLSNKRRMKALGMSNIIWACIAVVANPSHLEAVDPVVQGKLRAEAFYSNDKYCDRHLALMLHGDAAFSGQGVVFETFNMNDLPDYTINGAIHIVVNNQIDVGRVVGCPIFHVNSDDPEAVMHVCNVAAEWRKTFKKDVIIDLVCYRRHGHNELDEPMFTQPLMYQRVKQTKPVLDIYQKSILNEHVADEKYVDDELSKYGQICEDAYNSAKQITSVRNRDWLDSPWDDFFRDKNMQQLLPTGIEKEELEYIITKFSSTPEGFNLHRGLDRTLKGRREMLKDNSLDWSIGEALAFGSLLKEGIHVRLSGQDVERGTFSHRHHVLHDQKIDQKIYNPLNDLSENQAVYTVCNSSLSEYAVLGFELGYSMVNPHSLVMWEAQFGDFSNTAQCIIDQFISSGQSKWIRQTGLVMLLPHGYEGMGPEHSSARPERFLQMCNEDDGIDLNDVTFDEAFVARQLYDTNWIVANCTTPANLFHLLRRQILLPFRKPAIVMTPKSLLRHPMARSPVEDFLPDTSFKRVIPEGGIASQMSSKVERLIFCTGKSFPYDLIEKECKKYADAEIVWAQEEHKNMGAWTFIQPRFLSLLKPLQRAVIYAGRKPSASPATGNKYMHKKEQEAMIAAILNQPLE